MSETLKDRLAAMTKERDELICAIRKHRESGDSIVLDNKRLRDGIRRAMERIRPRLCESENEIAVECLAGNVVKEAFWKGEVSAFVQAEEIVSDEARIEVNP